MANEEHLAILKQGVEVWNKWRDENPDITPDLDDANLSRTDLGSANFSDSIVSGVILKDAFLWATNFSGAYLRDTDFTGARIAYTVFAHTNLSQAKGLESVQHLGPASIGIETLYQSKGQIPESFLRGCGVPDEFITLIPAIIGAQQAIQFYSCFISYSTKDEEFAERLHSRMRDNHLRVWFAPEDIKGGQKIPEQLERAIQVHDRLLIVLSESSM